MDKVCIIGGGYSAAKYNVDSRRLPGYVIGVNDAAIYGSVSACCSMDRLWMEARWQRLLDRPLPTWTRMATLKQKYQWPTPEWMTIVNCDYKSAVMSDEPGTLNGTNSGLFAVNLAYQLHPGVLELYGLDGSLGPHGEKHWYRDYSWRKPTDKGTAPSTYNKWERDLSNAIKQCRAAGIDVKVMK